MCKLVCLHVCVCLSFDLSVSLRACQHACVSVFLRACLSAAWASRNLGLAPCALLCIIPAERNHVGIDAVEKDMLLILDIISNTQVTGGVVTLIPCPTWQVTVSKRGVRTNTKSETSCTANDIAKQVEKHVLGKDVRRMSDQSPFCRKSTPLVISRVFAVVFFRMHVRIR